MKTPFFLALVGLVAITPQYLLAEEEEPFFERDFAKSPDRDHATVETAPRAAESPTATARAIVTRSASTELSDRVKEIAAQAREQGGSIIPPTPGAPLPGSKQTMQVALVGAILDATKGDVLEQQLEDMLAIVRELKILISTIYCIGPRIELAVKTRYEITKLQGRVLFVDELPEKYKAVKQSPTWVLSSLDQEIIIEGSGPLSKNLNTKGEIITQATEKIPVGSNITPKHGAQIGEKAVGDDRPPF